MRILVTGRHGQVARSLQERAKDHSQHELIAMGRPELDLFEPERIVAVLERVRPDIVISAAAYTAVDRAEDEPDLARQINGTAPAMLAREAQRLGARILHLSTDYVFSGEGARSYDETAATAPRSVYGATKLLGEEAMLADPVAGHLVLRTAWVYSPFGGNFVKTMLRLAGERTEIGVVGDQFGSPTSALDIADGLFAAIDGLARGDPGGLYHLAGSGEGSWADLAREVFAASRRHGGPFAQVRDIATSDYPTKALRPVNSRLDSSAFAGRFGYVAPDWRQSVQMVVARLVAERHEGTTA